MVYGLIIPIITPCKKQLVDLPSVQKHISFLDESHIDGIFVLSHTGEFEHIPLDQKLKMIDMVCALSKSPVLIGINAADEEEVLELYNYALKTTAHAVVLAPQLYSNPQEILDKLLKQGECPIYLYNNPHIQNNKNLSLSFIKQNSTQVRVAGIIDHSGNLGYFDKLLDLDSTTFLVLQGEETLFEPALEEEVSGYVFGTANVAPNYYKSILETKSKKLLEKVPELHADINKRGKSKYVQGIKNALVDMQVISSDEMFKE